MKKYLCSAVMGDRRFLMQTLKAEVTLSNLDGLFEHNITINAHPERVCAYVWRISTMAGAEERNANNDSIINGLIPDDPAISTVTSKN